MLEYDNEKNTFLIDGKQILLTPELQSKIENLNWYQSIPFTQKVKSWGDFNCIERTSKYYLDKLIVAGKSVLGIGCFEGFHLYVAEAKGATRVVGIADDFNLKPPIVESRKIAKELLNSKVEFIEKKVFDVTKEEIGEFDIVFLFDCLHLVSDPLKLIKHASSFSKDVIFICNHTVREDNSDPWCRTVKSYESSDDKRTQNIFNNTWLVKAIESCNLKILKGTTWEIDYFSFCCSKNQIPVHQKIPYSELPADFGEEYKTAIVMFSCIKYRSVWDPFMTLFRKYWPDCPYKFYFGTDFGSIEGVETLALNQDGGWSSNSIKILNQIPEERVIIFQEDFLINNPVDTLGVRKLVKHTIDFDIASLRLISLPRPTGQWYASDILGTYGQFDDFRFSFQLSIWKKDIFTKLLKEGENPWEAEFIGGRRSFFVEEPFLGVWYTTQSPIRYIPYAVVRGVWSDEALNFLKKENISVNLTEGKKVADVIAFKER